MNTTRNEVRKAFKAIGYKVRFDRNPFNDGLVVLAFCLNDEFGFIPSKGCFGVDFYNKHRSALMLACEYQGKLLVDTDQKIV